MLVFPTTQTVFAQGQADLIGTASSDAKGKMEGVVVTANKPGSIVSVTTDTRDHYAFPENRLELCEYTISVRAVGYDVSPPTKATVEAENNRYGRHQAQQNQKSGQPAHKRRVSHLTPFALGRGWRGRTGRHQIQMRGG